MPFTKEKLFQAHYPLYIPLLLSLSLLSSNRFVSPFEFSWYGHNIAAGIMVIAAGIAGMWLKKVRIGYMAPVVAFAAYTAWTVWDRSSAVPVPFYHGWMLLPVGLLLLGAYTVLISGQMLQLLQVGRIVTLLAAGEAMVCLLQYAKVVAPPGDLYPVSGTLVNPNLTAIFLAMTLPLLLFTGMSDRTRFRFFVPVASGITGIALLLLQSRTAIIGAGIAVLYFFAGKYQWRSRLQVLLQDKRRLVWIILAVLVVLPMALYGIYHYKKASSDSRLFIWKVSMEMVAEKPVSGYGYFSFEKSYNLAQSAYFESGRGSSEDRYNASHIRIGYNDFIQNLVEGGIVGFLLYLLFIGSLLWLGLRHLPSPESAAAYSGVLVFSVMSLFNTAELTVPVFSMLILYTAFLCVGAGGREYYLGKWIPAGLLILPAVGVVFYQLKGATASLQVKKAVEYSQEGKNEEALDLLKPLSITLKYSENYWTINALIFQKMKKYESAGEQFGKALQLTSAPEIYIKQSECLMEAGKYDEALQSCSTALNMVPSKLLPRYTLMKIYEHKADTLQALIIAEDIMNQTPKGASKKADFYKKEAQNLIESYKQQNQ